MGPEHPALALIHNNLGAIYAYQEKWGQAKAAYTRALAFGQAHLGPAHPDTRRASSMATSASCTPPGAASKRSG